MAQTNNGDESILSYEEVAEQVKAMLQKGPDFLKCLSEQQMAVYVRRSGILDGKQHTLLEVSQELGVTRETVRQTDMKAYRVLEEKLKENK